MKGFGSNKNRGITEDKKFEGPQIPGAKKCSLKIRDKTKVKMLEWR